MMPYGFLARFVNALSRDRCRKPGGPSRARSDPQIAQQSMRATSRSPSPGSFVSSIFDKTTRDLVKDCQGRYTKEVFVLVIDR
jgi:hypothetical protein